MTSAMPSWARRDPETGVQVPRLTAGGREPHPDPSDQSRPEMTKSAKPAARIEKLMDLAERALKETHYFEAERAASEALGIAHADHDYEAMVRILMPLQESRRQIRLAASDTGKLFIMNERPGETARIKPGCYLFEPPLVGADAREMLDRATREEVPVMTLAREPAVKSLKLDRRPGDWPVVMIGPVTLRAYVRPPKNNKPTLAWYLDACEALGDRAVADIDPGLDAASRVDELFERIHTLIDHEKLMQALHAACKQAIVAPAPAKKPRLAGDELEDELDDLAKA